jgi:hypothetical protein
MARQADAKARLTPSPILPPPIAEAVQLGRCAAAALKLTMGPSPPVLPPAPKPSMGCPAAACSLIWLSLQGV